MENPLPSFYWNLPITSKNVVQKNLIKNFRMKEIVICFYKSEERFQFLLEEVMGSCHFLQ